MGSEAERGREGVLLLRLRYDSGGGEIGGTCECINCGAEGASSVAATSAITLGDGKENKMCLPSRRGEVGDTRATPCNAAEEWMGGFWRC